MGFDIFFVGFCWRFCNFVSGSN